MPTECSADLFGFAPVEGREVVAAFDGGAITSDAGALLLGAADRAIKLTERLARISHTIFARSSKVERGFVSFCGDVLARGVGRRERELGFFRSCGCSEQFDLSVGLG